MPPGRILATFESREIKACAVGWLRTPEREAYARFSLPLYENKALGVVVASETAHELGPAPSLDRLLAAGLTWGMRRGFSYGEVFDAAFKKYPGQNTRLFSDSRLMVRLIAKHRLDATLVCPEELSAQLVAEPELGAAIRFLPIAEAPPGFARHIMTLAENIGLPLSQYTGLSPAEIRELASLKLALVGLAGFEDFYPSEISGGMESLKARDLRRSLPVRR